MLFQVLNFCYGLFFTKHTFNFLFLALNNAFHTFFRKILFDSNGRGSFLCNTLLHSIHFLRHSKIWEGHVNETERGNPNNNLMFMGITTAMVEL